ncbi:transketolase family protein [Paenibacillus humicus]|uniref:transketolase family protein n=1 Tax=Paenibacillus humicus TaxID=412861 RepID=UPI003D2C9582
MEGIVTFATKAMKDAVTEEIIKLAEENEFITMGTDGSHIFDKFAEVYPDRYVDVGIAEQNLFGVASGLAYMGHTVMVSSIASFLLRRAYEQIRLDICNLNFPVIIIGFSAGLSYGTLGSTHHLTEDIGLTRLLPNMLTLVPADAIEARRAVHTALKWKGPVYIRLGNGEERVIHKDESYYEDFMPEIVSTGDDAILFANGYCVAEAMLARDQLLLQGIHVTIANVHTVQPINKEFIRMISKEKKVALVVEEHVEHGGLGSAIAEIFSEAYICPLIRLGISDNKPPVASREQLISFYGIDANHICEKIIGYFRNWR